MLWRDALAALYVPGHPYSYSCFFLGTQGLAGVDFLTISPKLLQDLEDDKSELKQVLSVDAGWWLLCDRPLALCTCIILVHCIRVPGITCRNIFLCSPKAQHPQDHGRREALPVGHERGCHGMCCRAPAFVPATCTKPCRFVSQATEKLSEGIRNFAKDTLKLEADIKARIAAL